jgi:alpha-1,6-mannosyltransferase
MYQPLFRHKLYYLALVLSLVIGADLALHPYSPDAPTFLSGYVRRGLEYALLNGVYLIWLFQEIQYQKKLQAEVQVDPPVPQSFSRLLRLSMGFLFAAWMGFPATSDPFLYLHLGVMSWSGHNPYLTGAGDVISQFSPSLAWFQTATYGPVSLGVFMAVTGIVSSVVGSIYLLKTLFLLVHLVNAALIWNETQQSRMGSFITLAYLMNPILLFEQVGNARVDVLVCTSLILLVGSLRKGHYVQGAIALLLGIFSKTLPIIWVAQWGMFLLRSKRWKSIGVSIFLAIVLVLILFQTLLPTPKAWVSLLNPGVAWQTAGSFHDILNQGLTLAKSILPLFISEKQGGLVRLLKILTYLLYCGYYAWICGQAYFSRRYSASHLVSDMGWATLILFLFATPWYQPWYATILLCFVALLNFAAPRFCLIAITYAVCSTVAYYIFSGVAHSVSLLIASIITVIPTTLLLCFLARVNFSEQQTAEDCFSSTR